MVGGHHSMRICIKGSQRYSGRLGTPGLDGGYGSTPAFTAEESALFFFFFLGLMFNGVVCFEMPNNCIFLVLVNRIQLVPRP